MKSTVIVPTYNREKYLARCVRSLLNQSEAREDYEIIVVNDGSSDGTSSILKSFGDSVRVVNNDRNLGLPASLNAGIRAASGRYFVRVDSDDYVNHEFVRFLRVAHELMPGVKAISCDYTLVDDEENVISVENATENPIGCGIMFDLSAVKKVGLYNETFLAHEDKEFMLRFLKDFSVARLPIPLYRYRRHDENMTNDHDLMEKFDRKLKST